MKEADIEEPSADELDDLPLFQFEPLSPTPARPVCRWRHGAALFVLMGFISLMAWGSFQMGQRPAKSEEPVLSSTSGALLGQTTLELVFFGLFWCVAWLFSRASPDDLFLRWRDTWQNVSLGLVYSISLRFVVLVVAMSAMMVALISGFSVAEITQFVKSVSPTPERMVNVKALRSDPVYSFLIMTWVSFIVAGLREELWRVAVIAACAKVFAPPFSVRGAQIFGVITSSLFFGMAHYIQGWIAVAMTAVLGLSLGAITLVHRSLWPAVIAHGAFNALSFLLLRWQAA